MRITDPDLAALNRRFEASSPEAIVAFVLATFGGRAALLSSMQRSDGALCHLVDRRLASAPSAAAADVLFVDTGVLHAETLATRDALARTHPRLRVRTLAPAEGFAAQTARLGVLYLTKEGQEQCCDLRKSAPLLAERGRYDALLSAIRRSEGGARAKVPVFAVDPSMNALRVHPFAFFGDGLDRYLEAHADVAVNPLHAWGFPSIGCFPCTTPVLADEPERAGRWRHLASVTYCGINPVDRAEAPAAIDLDDRYAEALRDP